MLQEDVMIKSNNFEILNKEELLQVSGGEEKSSTLIDISKMISDIWKQLVGWFEKIK